MAETALTGDTYPVKKQLLALGAHWTGRAWMIDDSVVDLAQAVINSGPPRATLPEKKPAKRVPRHYIALHGLRNSDVETLGFEEITVKQQ